MKYQAYIVIFALSLMLTSCKKYLDIQGSSQTRFIENAADCQLLLDNSGVFNGGDPNDGQISSDDYYLGSNVFPGVINDENRAIYTWSVTAVRADANPQWLLPYRKMYQASLVLETLDKIKGSTDQATWNNLRGSALFYRAYSLWTVAQLYCKPYSATAAQDPGVPARISSDINDFFGRGTVKDTYDQITKDLEEAAGLLNPTSIIPARPNKAAAYAMLARVYLSMEDYGKALTNATASLAIKRALLDYNDDMVDKTSNIPFSQFNKDIVFYSSLIMGTDPYDRNKKLLYPGDRNSPQAVINLDLYNTYNDNDLRKTVFFKPNNNGTYRFTGNYNPSTDADLFSGLTVGEMYLTRAECYARAENLDAALADLNTLLNARWVSGSYTNMKSIDASTNTGDKVLKVVLSERRKELVMRGQRWTDLRRLNKDSRFKTDLTRTIGNAPNTTTYTLPANDLRYVLLIPQEVINTTPTKQNLR